MAVAVRMRKIGKLAKKRFYFRIGVINEQKNRDGRVIEDIGSYEPAKKEDNFKIDLGRYEYWRQKGAVISPTIKSMIKKINKGK
ncbi:MAG: 30S ribosomal protein S16 [Omnitrophica WOR_2 bacterium RIFCSPHIGHO2_02_FULL_45_21]|nr:MAG: 30S ribosomal protein S16 [Omnitrophica WOR_2 bacterium RIFCSPHIGHO2_02_FULL_45_21]